MIEFMIGYLFGCKIVEQVFKLLNKEKEIKEE